MPPDIPSEQENRKQDKDCKITFSLKFYWREQCPKGLNLLQSRGAPANAGGSARSPTWEEDPGGRAGIQEQAHKKRAGVRLKARDTEPSFVPSPFQPHAWYLLQEFQSRSLSQQLPGAAAPFAVPFAVCRGRASEARPQCPPEAGGEGAVSAAGRNERSGGYEGRSREGARWAATAWAFTEGGDSALPRRANPGWSRPASGLRPRELWERCQRPGKSSRQRLRYEGQDVTRNSSRFCCQAILNRAISQKGLKQYRHIVLIVVSPPEGSLKSSACGRGLQYHSCVGLHVRCTKGRSRKVSRLCSLQAPRGLQHLRGHLYPPTISCQWRQHGKRLLAHV